MDKGFGIKNSQKKIKHIETYFYDNHNRIKRQEK